MLKIYPYNRERNVCYRKKLINYKWSKTDHKYTLDQTAIYYVLKKKVEINKWKTKVIKIILALIASDLIMGNISSKGTNETRGWRVWSIIIFTS